MEEEDVVNKLGDGRIMLNINKSRLDNTSRRVLEEELDDSDNEF